MLIRFCDNSLLCTLTFSRTNNIFIYRGINMGNRVKPVQATEIKDKKIVYDVIEQIRRKPTAAALKRHKAEEEDLIKLLKK